MVQGVGFRPWVHGLARGSGVAGFVRNDGGVVVVEAEGPAHALDALEQALRTSAPPPARVERLVSRALEPTGARTFAVVASDDLELAVRLQVAVNSTVFRVYVSDDVAGVELCAAAKNVIALAAGGADGLRLGDNAKAALVSRGLAEMRRLAEAAGARPDTFAGLAGMGDLIVTCWAPTGRNRRAGELIAQGATAAEARAAIGMVVEGLTAAPVIRDLSHRLDIELPITDGVCAVLEGESLTGLVETLMRRAPTTE